MAVKPFCSGGRDDARRIREALGGRVRLDQLNPWHFRAALTPLLAARIEGVRLKWSDCLEFLRSARSGCDTLLIEGAGGLLSPLGEGFDARDLILELRATPLIVCPNQLGAINQTRLVLEALPRRIAGRSRVVLIEPEKQCRVSKSNTAALREIVGSERIHTFPRVDWPGTLRSRRLPRSVSNSVAGLLNQKA